MNRILLSIEHALSSLFMVLEPLSLEEVPLLEALSRVLAEDIQASSDLPTFNNSSRHGSAVRVKDVAGVTRRNPACLKVIGDVFAGVG
ncbi:MAG: hypothetical protein A2Z14_09385 [Chloroflexi bacterium RBG_16_48_8]|nr:MAG: hypothetical protein A2Z14_09385 [Chloroflexi bacterium RBG_16_48_8]